MTTHADHNTVTEPMNSTETAHTSPAADDATRAELHAIQVSAEALAALEDTEVRARVVRYLVDRFNLGPISIYPHYRR